MPEIIFIVRPPSRQNSCVARTALGARKDCNRVPAELREVGMGDVARRRADWSTLRVFFAVAETGGINAAARALRLNPSTVTRAIEELERQLNVTLFHRGPRGTVLTEVGEIAFQRVR